MVDSTASSDALSLTPRRFERPVQLRERHPADAFALARDATHGAAARRHGSAARLLDRGIRIRGAPGGAGGPCLSRMHQAPSVDAGSGGRGPTMVLHSNRERVHDLRAWREDALVFLLSAPPQTTCTRSRTVLAPRGDSPFACKRSSVLIWPRTRRRPSVAGLWPGLAPLAPSRCRRAHPQFGPAHPRPCKYCT